MMALAHSTIHYGRILDISIIDNKLFTKSGFTNIREGFFDEPEHNFNKVIIDAYNSFLIETILLEDNNE